jgi:nitric oxide dioxygenase
MITRLNDSQLSIVKDTWNRVLINHEENFGRKFYELLFSRYPEIRKLFNEDMLIQSHKIASMITFIVARASSDDRTLEKLKALGDLHRSLQIESEHYSMAGEVLVDVLHEHLKDDWSEEIRNAWLEFYSLVVFAMTEGKQ